MAKFAWMYGKRFVNFWPLLLLCLKAVLLGGQEAAQYLKTQDPCVSRVEFN